MCPQRFLSAFGVLTHGYDSGVFYPIEDRQKAAQKERHIASGIL